MKNEVVTLIQKTQVNRLTDAANLLKTAVKEIKRLDKEVETQRQIISDLTDQIEEMLNQEHAK